MRSDMSTLNENVIHQGDSNGFTGTSRFCGSFSPLFDRGDSSCFVVRRKQETIADPHGSRFDTADDDSLAILPIHVLNWEPERELGRRGWWIQSIQTCQQIASLEPGHSLAPRGNVITSLR